VSLGAALLGAALLWWSPSDAVRFAAMLLLGSGLGPLFPTLISLAPALFGGRAVQVVGYQIAAAAVGGAVIIALTGLVLQRWGLFLLPATLFGGVAATLVFYHAGLWLTRHPAGGPVERGATELGP
jgi:fucose permease